MKTYHALRCLSCPKGQRPGGTVRNASEGCLRAFPLASKNLKGQNPCPHCKAADKPGKKIRWHHDGKGNGNRAYAAGPFQTRREAQLWCDAQNAMMGVQ